jgi:hypothetical protein
MNKLLQECKDEVARKHGWLHFQELIDDKNFEGGFDIMNEAMQLYAERYAKGVLEHADQRYLFLHDENDPQNLIAEFNSK